MKPPKLEPLSDGVIHITGALYLAPDVPRETRRERGSKVLLAGSGGGLAVV